MHSFDIVHRVSLAKAHSNLSISSNCAKQADCLINSTQVDGGFQAIVSHSSSHFFKIIPTLSTKVR